MQPTSLQHTISHVFVTFLVARSVHCTPCAQKATRAGQPELCLQGTKSPMGTLDFPVLRAF